MDTRPPQPPEGRLIGDAAERLDLSIREAARRAGISYGRWRQIVQGYQNVSPGNYAIVRIPDTGRAARTLAKMAAVAGVTPEQMETIGQRPAIAEVMRSLPGAPRPVLAGESPPDAPPGFISREAEEAARPFRDEIWLRRGEWREKYASAHPGIAPSDIPEPPGAALFGEGSPDAQDWDRMGSRGLDLQGRIWVLAATQVHEARAKDREAAGLTGPVRSKPRQRRITAR
jgi:hypothetical protein